MLISKYFLLSLFIASATHAADSRPPSRKPSAANQQLTSSESKDYAMPLYYSLVAIKKSGGKVSSHTETKTVSNPKPSIKITDTTYWTEDEKIVCTQTKHSASEHMTSYNCNVED